MKEQKFTATFISSLFYLLSYLISKAAWIYEKVHFGKIDFSTASSQNFCSKLQEQTQRDWEINMHCVIAGGLRCTEIRLSGFGELECNNLASMTMREHNHNVFQEYYNWTHLEDFLKMRNLLLVYCSLTSQGHNLPFCRPSEINTKIENMSNLIVSNLEWMCNFCWILFLLWNSTFYSSLSQSFPSSVSILFH